MVRGEGGEQGRDEMGKKLCLKNKEKNKCSFIFVRKSGTLSSVTGCSTHYVVLRYWIISTVCH